MTPEPVTRQAPGLRSLDRCVVGRDRSLFMDDLEANRQTLRNRLGGRRVLVVGGGGTIGSATINLLLEFGPSTLHVIDQNENYLADLVRDIRNRLAGSSRIDLRLWPIDYGGPIARRLIADEPPYDIVFNFAALKHVRSEKDAYSILQMIDTNVVRQARFKQWIAARGGCTRYFGVSTDKAANPTSVMGATKRLMEEVLFGVATTPSCAVTSARFANVAFSNGSLLQAWLRRLELGQPLAVPRSTRRYFMTRDESAEVCVLAGLIAADGEIIVPRLDPEKNLRLLETLAADVLELAGLAAATFADEEAARDALVRLRSNGQWPLILMPPDTSGEKPFEEFVGEGETLHEASFKHLLGVSYTKPAQLSADVIDELARLVAAPTQSMAKADVVAALSALLPTFRHIETGKSLDERL